MDIAVAELIFKVEVVVEFMVAIIFFFFSSKALTGEPDFGHTPF